MGRAVLSRLVARVGADRPTDSIVFDDVEVLQRTAGGTVIGDGLLRIHTTDSASEADHLVGEGYPEFSARVRCFAFDWLGRQFSLDLTSAHDERVATILMFEPGSGEALEIPVGLVEFFHEEIVEYSDAALAEGFFDQWRASGGRTPTFTECIGYQTPLFLGGTDDLSNLKLTDISVYWGLFGQLRLRARGLPAQTRIKSVRISDALQEQ